MAAFEKISSGIPEMDMALDHIRFGDNVVWQVSHLSEFECFMKPFVKQAVADKRNLIYVRFASHDPVMKPQEGAKIYHIDLTHRFETFAVAIHNMIEAEGRDTFYIFDCLSELQSAWATDLMMGNFFKGPVRFYPRWMRTVGTVFSDRQRCWIRKVLWRRKLCILCAG